MKLPVTISISTVVDVCTCQQIELELQAFVSLLLADCQRHQSMIACLDSSLPVELSADQAQAACPGQGRLCMQLRIKGFLGVLAPSQPVGSLLQRPFQHCTFDRIVPNNFALRTSPREAWLRGLAAEANNGWVLHAGVDLVNVQADHRILFGHTGELPIDAHVHLPLSHLQPCDRMRFRGGIAAKEFPQRRLAKGGAPH
eukprot:CAMPEP_0115735176 /NCGR_PEP_ID=MMETSP0272-20121206/86580_1 /TAXON_ID=71861 /ORGANISM="Scrippsiella trochoidea, Strain CCMP3099" /LENGTH=198 /DNA_ID=CAMNT_0003179265 /DNA_START=86 /DNA_END=682 /DNA_ORIENTATION=-